MLRHYLTVAVRNARRAPVTSAISLLTLAVGFVAALTAYAFVGFWNSAERHFPNADRTYVLTSSSAFPGGFARTGLIETPEHVAELLRTDFPSVERVARAVLVDRQMAVAGGGDAVRASAVAVDPEFLEIFPLAFVAGDRERALREPRSLVVTAELARRLFGDADPIGQRVVVGNLVDATVTGVLAAVPEPSHMGRSTSAVLQFDMLSTMDVGDEVRASIMGPVFAATRMNWFGGGAYTYLLLPPDGSAPREFERQLEGFITRHVPPAQLGDATLSFGLRPVTGILRGNVDTELFSADLGMSVSTVLLLLGVLVLSVAALNYGTLATARAARRAREIAVRKSLGAHPFQVAAQHLLETAVYGLCATFVAFGLIWLASPVLRQITGVPFLYVALTDWTFWWLAVLTVLAVMLLAGAYPALVLARLHPLDTRFGSTVRVGRVSLFTWLVGAQFACASFLLIAVFLLSNQNSHLRRVALGDVGSVVLIENRNATTKIDPATLRQELERLPQVAGVTERLGMPWQRLVLQGPVSGSPDGSGVRRVVQQVIGPDFFDVMQIRVLAGRPLSRDYAADLLPASNDSDTPSVVVDAAFAEEFGFGAPDQAVDKLVYRSVYRNGASVWRPNRIVGVVENRHSNLRSAGAASTIYQLAEPLDVTVVALAPTEIAAGLDGIDRVWRGLAPNVAINRHFFSEAFEQSYGPFARIQGVFNALSVMAVIIATAGLLGIAGVVIGRRRKEIGIRKVCGASVGRITRMLLAGFSVPVVVAAIAVWPIAYAAADAYLAVFIDRIGLTPLPFVVSLAAMLGIAWAAVIAQTVLAARAQPTRVLRHD